MFNLDGIHCFNVLAGPYIYIFMNIYIYIYMYIIVFTFYKYINIYMYFFMYIYIYLFIVMYDKCAYFFNWQSNDSHPLLQLANIPLEI